MEPTPGAEGVELYGTETMAELCARQGRLGDAIRIYQALMAQNPTPEKLTRWTERSRALERARAYAPDVTVVRRIGGSTPTPIVQVMPDLGQADKTEPNAVLPEVLAAARAPDAPEVTAAPAPPPAPKPEEPHQLPLVVTQTVRSGQVVYARRNDLIVLGSVNSGGQVVADGNVHIYGALRGRAIAGAQGAQAARIFCQKLEAELLAVSGIYLIWDDLPEALRGKAAQVWLQGETCMVTPL